MKKPFTGSSRTLLQALLLLLGVGLLAVPPLVLTLSATGWSDALWSGLRVGALEAFTLVFIDIMIGSFRPFFVRVYKGRTVQRAHEIIAFVAFVVAVSHGATAFVFGIAGYTVAAVWTGPGVLVALAAVLITALERRRLRRSWRWVHRLNYLIFVAVLVHGLVLGYDLRNEAFLQVWFGLFAAAVAVGLAYRVVTQLGGRRATG